MKLVRHCAMRRHKLPVIPVVKAVAITVVVLAAIRVAACGNSSKPQPSSSLHRNNSSRCSRNIRSRRSNSNRSSNHNNGRRSNSSNHPPMILGHPHHQPMVVSGALMMSLRSKTQ